MQHMHSPITKRSIILLALGVLIFYIAFVWVPGYCAAGACTQMEAQWYKVFLAAFGALFIALGSLAFKRH
jgi:hypothetical protein